MSEPRLRSLAATALLWIYFIGAFLLGYWVVFLVAGLLRGRRGIAWTLASYMHGFFLLLRLLIPKLGWSLPSAAELRKVRGSVIVSNHISFLDPLLLMSRFPAVITIVRPDFFRVPVFGWLLRGAGFLGPDLFAEGQTWIAKVERHLKTGGNLLVFPEGTRSRDGRLAPFKKGAFFLAKRLAAPIVVMRIAGTGGVFPPGRLRFDARPGHAVRLEQLFVISVEHAANQTTHELCSHVHRSLAAATSSDVSSTGEASASAS